MKSRSQYLAALGLFIFLTLGPSTRPYLSDRKNLGESSKLLTNNQLRKAYGLLPLAFEKNVGQADPSVMFLARGRGYSLYLGPSQAAWVLSENPLRDNPKRKRPFGFSKTRVQIPKSSIVRMRLIGANPRSQALGVEELPGKSNYLIGKNTSRWKTNLSQFAKVKFSEIYDKVDLVYYGAPGKLEYDFIVKPGGNPKNIRLAFGGIQKLNLSKNGDLEIGAGREKLELKLPKVYQEGRKAVQARFVVKEREVGFEVGEYDPTLPLIIDPTVVVAYSSYVGGGLPTSNNEFMDMAVDNAGNLYMVEVQVFNGGYPTTPGAYQSVSKGTQNPLIIKMNPTGTALVYATYLGGSDLDFGNALAVDSGGNVYVTGSANSADFPTTPGAFQPSLAGTPPINGESNAFVTKLNPTGTGLVYSTYLGGSQFPHAGYTTDYGIDIAVDSSGNAYVTGTAESSDFPVTPGSYQPIFHDGKAYRIYDLFVTKLNPTGTGLDYSTYLGGTDGEQPGGIAVDASGCAYVTGTTFSADYPVTPGAFQTLFTGVPSGYAGNVCFVTKLNTLGSALVYSTFLGGNGGDQANAIALDGFGNAYVTGFTGSADFPVTPGSFQPAYPSGIYYPGFVTKLNASGTGLAYSSYFGGPAGGEGVGITVNGAGCAYVGGQTFSSGFPTTPGALQPLGFGFQETIWFIVDPTGASMLYSTYWGGSLDGEDDGAKIALDGVGNIYVAGSTYAPDFPVTGGAYQTSLSIAEEDLFISKFGVSGLPTPVATPTRTPTATPTVTPTFTPTITATPTITFTSTPLCLPQVWPNPFNPFYAGNHSLKFSCLPPNAKVSIYTISGELVGQAEVTGDFGQWYGVNRNGSPASPGVYYYVIESGARVAGKGKFLMTR